jgi:hypothetical protein
MNWDEDFSRLKFHLHDCRQDNLYFLNFHGIEDHYYGYIKYPVEKKESLMNEIFV